MPLLKEVRRNEEGRLVGITESGKQIFLSVSTPRFTLMLTSDERDPRSGRGDVWDLRALRKDLTNKARNDRRKYYKLGRGSNEVNKGTHYEIVAIPYEVYREVKQ